MRFVSVGALVVLAACGPARSASASVGWGVTVGGAIHQIDTSNPAVAPSVGFAIGSFVDCMTRDPDTGLLWLMSWSGQLASFNPTTGVTSNFGTVLPPAPGSGFYKDFAWDPINDRLIATHLGSSGNRLVVINTDTRTSSLLAPITGLSQQGTQVLGLAINGAGHATILDFGNGRTCDLGLLPVDPVASITAIPRPTQSFPASNDIRGLEYDQVTGELFASGMSNSGSFMWSIASDGETTILPGSAGRAWRDMTFIPAPSAMVLLGGTGCLAMAARRRAACSLSHQV